MAVRKHLASAVARSCLSPDLSLTSDRPTGQKSGHRAPARLDASAEAPPDWDLRRLERWHEGPALAR